MLRTRPSFSILLTGLLSAIPWSATAATSVVSDWGDTGAPGQLRTLITAAASGDTIVIPPGTIVLTGPSGEDANVSGDLDIRKALTIVGSGSALTTIDANRIDRAIEILPTGSLVLSGVTVRNGRVDPETGFGGGGIRNAGVLRLVLSVVETSSSGGGGGLFNDGIADIESTTFRGNYASGTTGAGGGLMNFATLTIADSTITGNATAGPSASANGGGVSNVGKMEMTNVTVSGNRSFGHGGGIFEAFTGTSLILRNVTIADNTARLFGGGLEVMGVAPRPVNTIIAHNRSTTLPTGGDCSGPIESLGYNLIEDVSACTIGGVTAGNILGAAARLEPLGDNGGPTLTHALRRSSPAIDAGSNPEAPAHDQRGVPRPQDGNRDGSAVTDMGAFELPAR